MWDTSPRIIRYPINFQICWCFSDLSPGSMLPSALHGTAPHHAVSELVAGLQGSPSKSWGEVLVFFLGQTWTNQTAQRENTRARYPEILCFYMLLYVFCTWICCLRISQLGSLADAQTFWDALEVFCDRRSWVAASPDGTSVMSLALPIPHWPRLCWWSLKRPPPGSVGFSDFSGFQASSVQSANLFVPEHIRSWSNFAVCQGQ